ncbi:MAG: ANTAR domain-containing protein [Eubacterium sp.]
MEVNSMTEMQAHKYLQKESMHTGKKLSILRKKFLITFSKG